MISIPNGTPPPLRHTTDDRDRACSANFNPQRDATALATTDTRNLSTSSPTFQSPTGRHRPCDIRQMIATEPALLISIPNGTPPPLRLRTHETSAHLLQHFNPQRDATALATAR